MNNYCDFKLTNNKTKSFIGGSYISNKRINTNLDFICQINLKDLNIDNINNGILYFFYDLDNNINYDLNNNKRCLVYYEDKFFKKEQGSSKINKIYLEENNDDNFDVRFLGKEVALEEHKEAIELLDRKYDLSKNVKVLNYVLEDVKNNCDKWTLLLQIRSTKEFKIGDNGSLYFYIKKEDLKNLNFNNVYCIKESC